MGKIIVTVNIEQTLAQITAQNIADTEAWLKANIYDKIPSGVSARHVLNTSS